MSPGDSLIVEGLGVLLDEEDLMAPFLELTLRHSDITFRAMVLRTGEEYALTVKDSRGESIVLGEFFRTQAEAILAAELAVLTVALELGE